MNKVILTGRLVNNMELQGDTGKEWASNTIAVRREYKNKEGEYESDFINIKLFKGQALYVNNYCTKGDLVEIVGKWQKRKYVTQQGENRYIDECVVESVSRLSPKQETQEQPVEQQPFNLNNTDDLPF